MARLPASLGGDAIGRRAARLGIGGGKPVLLDLSQAARATPLILECPFPSEINSRTGEAQKRTLEWARRFDLVSADARDRAALEKYTGLVGRMFPEGSPEAFQVVSDYTTWLFIHDDLCDESGMTEDSAAMAEFFEREFALLLRRREPDPTKPIEMALADLRDRLEALAPDTSWFVRFCVSVRDYFEACTWEAANRARRAVPAAREYIPLRRCAGAVWMYLHFIDLLAGSVVPIVVREQRSIQRLRQITCNLVAWHNDLYSLDKELHVGDVHNLVTVLMQENRLDARAALQLAVRYCNAEIQTFEAICADIGRDCDDPAVAHYAEAMKLFVRGALDWAREATRYSAPADMSLAVG